MTRPIRLNGLHVLSYKCFLSQVEVKPYVLDDQLCDECQGTRCGGKFAPFFCANVTCLQYYCEYCWAAIHSRAGREFHKPLVKEGGDRPRHISFRWNWSRDQGCAIRIHALFILLSPFYLQFFFKIKIVFILKFLILFFLQKIMLKENGVILIFVEKLHWCAWRLECIRFKNIDV